MKVLCVIPARGGSKGVPGKNLREVCGKPLVAWTILQALAVPGDVLVVVSTDSQEIAEASIAAGAEVPFLRPATLATDASATEPAVWHTIETLAADGYHPDAVVLLQATSPVRLPGTIARAVEQFESTGVDSLVGVVPQTPFLWRQGQPPNAEYDVDRRPRRQDLSDNEMFYRETGSLYVTRTDLYESPGNRIGGTIGLFVMDEIEGVDVDTEVDLVVAAQLLEKLGRERA